MEAPVVSGKPWIDACWWWGSINFTFIAWEPPLACLAWKILITDGREINEKGACLKISFTSVLKA